jgi:hypothetical protein
MSGPPPRRKCRCCRELFQLDYRNAHHQVYCAQAACRRASKAASQARWRRQPANREYFRGPENTQRVQAWRRAHPGYWHRKPKPSEPTQLAGDQPSNPEQTSCNAPVQSSLALQEVCLDQHPVVIGLIALVTGRTLQEDIAATTRQLQARGRDILGLENSRGP